VAWADSLAPRRARPSTASGHENVVGFEKLSNGYEDPSGNDIPIDDEMKTSASEIMARTPAETGGIISSPMSENMSPPENKKSFGRAGVDITASNSGTASKLPAQAQTARAGKSNDDASINVRDLRPERMIRHALGGIIANEEGEIESFDIQFASELLGVDAKALLGFIRGTNSKITAQTLIRHKWIRTLALNFPEGWHERGAEFIECAKASWPLYAKTFEAEGIQALTFNDEKDAGAKTVGAALSPKTVRLGNILHTNSRS
jgi:hypothetical protein